ncbi:polyprenyltransferase [Hymenobacter aquaticus]|uniref:Polyprenyltransferase n=1 Tax=Hymenobacter aquaticus TaxID=1867101 RepID=A0A4Z0PZJ1_9BACT|nr:UbiA-like protein EboC [Hymenobacter aquaticus]TGE22311.1 polyprenyltransferase [Hymenobacter aquaticus]
MKRVVAHLRLMRPANIITAVADILLGFAASGSAAGLLRAAPGARVQTLGWLVLATVGLYGGGVVFNDVCDAELDRLERPERPIPSGQATRLSAGLLGTGLLLSGIVAAWQVSFISGLLAAGIAALALLYDAWGKHHSWLGPLNMGACRGANLLLGLSAVPAALSHYWFIGLIPLVYIAAITSISRGEVHGGNKKALLGSLALYGLVVAAILAVLGLPQVAALSAVPFLLGFGYFIFPPLLRALASLQAQDVRQAVKAGVMALILLDATLAAGFAGWQYGVLVLLLFPVSRLLARVFAVT